MQIGNEAAGLSGLGQVPLGRTGGTQRADRTDRADRAASTERPRGAADASPAGAVTSPTAGRRAATEPARRALGAAQDGVTFTQIAEHGLGRIEGLLGDLAAAGPDEISSILDEIRNVSRTTAVDGAPVLTDLRSRPVSFATEPGGADGVTLDRDLSVRLDGAGGLISQDLLGAIEAGNVGSVARAAAADVAAERARIAGVRGELTEIAFSLVSEVNGDFSDLGPEQIRELLQETVQHLAENPGLAGAAQGGVAQAGARAALGA